MLWARRHFPESEGTGAAASHTQSGDDRAREVPPLPPFPFQKIENKQVKSTCLWRKCNMFRNTGRGKHLRSKKSFANFYYEWEEKAIEAIPVQSKQTSLFRNSCSIEATLRISLSNALDFWSRHFGYIWTNNQRPQSRAQFQLQSHSNSNEWCDGTL